MSYDRSGDGPLLGVRTVDTKLAARTGGYPFGEDPLVPAWRDRQALLFGGVDLVATACALWLRAPIPLAEIDEITLRILVPAFLAAVLAVAPRPDSHLGRIAKDFTTAALIASMFAGTWLAFLIGSFPLVLAAAALFSRTRASRYIWRDTA